VDKFKTKPMQHQLKCLNEYGHREYFGLLADMGTGKTWIILNNFADLWQSNLCAAVLVLAPNGVHLNWTRLELPQHMPDWVRYKTATWQADMNKTEQRAFEQFMTRSAGELRVFAMNWEAMSTPRGFAAAERFCITGSNLMIVADESDAVKNPNSIRTENLMKLKKYSRWRRIMTGTFVTQAPFDAFSQMSFLDEAILGTTSYFAFKAEYAEMIPAGSKFIRSIAEKANASRRADGKRSIRKNMIQIVRKGPGGLPKYRNLDKLSRLIGPHVFRVLKSECLDLPPKVYKTVLFELTKQQKEVYKKAKVECRLVFENRETPFNKLVAVQKLAQITSGYFLHPEAEEPVRIPGENPKLDLLVDRCKALRGNKIIIWARYRVEIADIVARLREEGFNVVEYHGGTSMIDRVSAIESFERGAADVWVGNQQAGGTGITLVAASYVIYFSNSFSLRDRLQSEDRAHRIGQTKSVTYLNLAGKGTVDESAINSLLNKKDVAEMIMDFERNLNDSSDF